DVVDRVERTVAFGAISGRDVAGRQLKQRGDGDIDVALVVVATQADPHHARYTSLVAEAGAIQPRRLLHAVHTQQMGDVGMRTEASTANADAVLVPEDGGDQTVIDPGDREREDPD